MSTVTQDILFAHIDAAKALIRATARATRKAHGNLPHIDAALALVTGAEAMLSAAQDVAEGRPVSGHGAKLGAGVSRLATDLRIAEGKLREAAVIMDGEVADMWGETRAARRSGQGNPASAPETAR